MTSRQALGVTPTAATGVAIVSLLPTMDLAEVTARVAREHPDWSQDRLEAAEAGYRQFWLTCKASKEPQRPTKDVDEVWHAHVLHTKRYAHDSQAYFGYFLHHTPDDVNCQGGGDGCTACGSGCTGGGTITLARCSDDEPII